MKYTMEFTDKDRARYWKKVDRSGGDDAFWPWLAYKNEKGYGRFRLNGKVEYAHRVAWELSNGPIPKDWEIDHECRYTCRDRSCCNYRHLQCVPPGFNRKQGQAKGNRKGAATQRAKTHCPQGHAYDTENTYRHPGRLHRKCRACARDSARIRYHAKG